MPPVGALAGRSLRAARLLARDRRVPRPLRWLAGIGLLPVPGPFDEVLLLAVAAVVAVFYREPVRDAWRSAAPATSPEALSGGQSL